MDWEGVHEKGGIQKKKRGVPEKRGGCIRQKGVVTNFGMNHPP